MCSTGDMRSLVVTPHAGEAASMLAALTESAPSREQIEACPELWAVKLAQATGGTVVLKGSSTIVCSCDESGKPVIAVNCESSSWAGVAGAGDVLAGVIGAVLAHPSCSFDRAEERVHAVGAAVWLHAQAGIEASGAVSMPETDDSTLSAERTTPPVIRRFVGGHPIGAADIAHAIPHVVGRVLFTRT